ncbi:MAG: WD40 repeat domain-containing protein [Anaerolineales bacterium]|nr:WD40 repeat domain-containing protein [Anaerolineales bacterium]
MRRNQKSVIYWAIGGGLGLLALLLWLRPTLLAPTGPKNAAPSTLEPAATVPIEGLVVSLAFSPDSHTLAVAAGNPNAKGSLTLWHLPEMQLSQTLAAEYNKTVWSVAFSPDGQTLATGSQTNQIQLWRVADGERLASWSQPTNPTDPKSVAKGVRAVAFSPDGQYLASAGVDTVWLWDVADGHLLFSMPNREPEVAFSPDGQMLATRSQDGQIDLWSVAERQVVTTIADPDPGLCPLAFSPDGQLIASCQRRGGINLLHLPDGEITVSLEGHSGGTSSVAFKPDGTILASGGVDDQTGSGEVVQPVSAPRLWRPDTGESVQRFKSSIGFIRALAFSPDGQWLASGGTDANVYLWAMK